MNIQKVTTELHKWQDKAVFSDKRFIALIAGIQSGKTVAGSVFSRWQYDNNSVSDGLICSPTYKILSQSTLPKLFAVNPDLRKYYKKGENVIEQSGRGKIFIRSTENPNTLEGMTLKWAWLDEAGQMKLDAWINIQGRLSILQGKCLITTTPYALNWLYHDFYQQWKQGNKDYEVIQFRSIDSPYFPKEEFERVKTTMDKRVFERRYEGLFTKMEGLVYDDFNYAFSVDDNAPKQFDTVLGGIDWGYEAPTALAVIGIRDSVYWLVDEYYHTRKTTEELIEAAKTMRDKWKIQRWYADSAEPDRIEAFNRAGVYTLPSDKDIEWGINSVRQLMRESRFKVHPRCKFFLDEIETYHYPEQKDDTETKEVPVKLNDHLCDSIRYIIATYQRPISINTKKRVIHKIRPFTI